MRTARGSSLLRGRLACVLALGIGIGSPAVATAAQPKAETEAEQLAETAKRRFKEGQFDLSARLFLRCFDLTARPAMLFNAARAYEAGGRKLEAIETFKKFIGVSPDLAGREEAKARVDMLEAALAKERQDAATRAQQELESQQRKKAQEAEGASESKKIALVEKTKKKTEPDRLAPDPAGGIATGATPREAPRPSRVWPTVGLIGGGALALTGGVLLLSGVLSQSSLEQDLATRDQQGHVSATSRADAVSRNDSIVLRKTVGAVVGGLGLALAASGGVLWWWTGRDARAVTVGLREGCLTLGGAF